MAYDCIFFFVINRLKKGYNLCYHFIAVCDLTSISPNFLCGSARTGCGENLSNRDQRAIIHLVLVE